MSKIKALLLGLLAFSTANRMEAGFHICKKPTGMDTIILGSLLGEVASSDHCTKKQSLKLLSISLALIAEGLIQNRNACKNSQRGNKRLWAAGACFIGAVACGVLSRR